MSATERALPKFAPLTYRESKYVVERSKGTTKYDALIAAGFTPGIAHNPQRVESAEVIAAIENYRAELAENVVQLGLIDATEIHEYLTDALRAKVSDIRRDNGSFIPTSEWPDIWQRMWEAGDVEVETLTERSSDGATKDKRGGWDGIGTVTKVKIKFSSRAKLLELAMKHRGVNAMVEAKSPELHLHLHQEITQRLQGALARKQRLIEGKTDE